MGAFLVYSIEVAVVMSALYLGYKLLLSSATFHSFNRVILIAIYMVSLSLPAAVPLLRFSTQKAAAEIGMPMATEILNETPESTPAIDTASPIMANRPPIDWTTLFSEIYFLGFLILLLITLLSLIKMIKVFSSGYTIDGYPNVIISDKTVSPFSWGGKIVISPSDMDSDFRQVISHEETHLRLYHWIDLAFAQAVAIFQWFSPASYLMMRELKIVHEFEVDEKVAASNPYSYQMMLIKKAAGSSFPTFADSLNSQLKTRITMMLSKKSNGKRRYAAAALLPMAAIAAFALSQPAVAGLLAKLDPAVSDSEFNKIPAIAQEFDANAVGNVENLSADTTSDNNLRIVAVGTTTHDGIPVGQVVKVSNDNKNVKTEASKDSGKAKGRPQCIIDGKPTEKDLVDYDPNTIESVTVKPSSEEYPNGCVIIYTKEYAKKHNIVSHKPQSTEPKMVDGRPVYVAVERPASFYGGTKALLNFLNENIKFPVDVKNDINLRVIVKFIINKNGEVSDPVILKSGGEPFDKEAIRVINMMPKWEPGENNGQPVDSYFTIPITFRAKEIPEMTPAETSDNK